MTAAAETLIDAAEEGNADGALGALGIHRLLCAHREGPYGVRRWSQTALSWTSAAAGPRSIPPRSTRASRCLSQPTTTKQA